MKIRPKPGNITVSSGMVWYQDTVLKQTHSAAKLYVDAQLATMRKYGSAPKDLSDGEYVGLVESVAELITDSNKIKET